LIGTGKSRITVKYFTYAVYTGSFVETGPEILLDMPDSVNAQAVNYVIMLAGQTFGMLREE
jgi:hypothetical protein